MNADKRRWERDGLCVSPDLDRSWAPRVSALQIIDHDRRPAGARDVTELLRSLELIPTYVNRLRRSVIDPGDRNHVRRAIGAHRRYSSQLTSARQIPNFSFSEDAQLSTAPVMRRLGVRVPEWALLAPPAGVSSQGIGLRVGLVPAGCVEGSLRCLHAGLMRE